MKQTQEVLRVPTTGRGVTDLTARVARVVEASGVATGLCVVFVAHTSCSLVVQENADPAAADDLLAWLTRLAPEGDPRYTHLAEGADDMPSHLRAAVTRTSESIPVVGSRLALGTWQGILLLEHRRRPHERRVIVHVTGV